MILGQQHHIRNIYIYLIDSSLALTSYISYMILMRLNLVHKLKEESFMSFLINLTKSSCEIQNGPIGQNLIGPHHLPIEITP